MLYRQSLTTPGALAGEATAADPGVASPGVALFEEHGKDGDFVYLKIAEAGQRILKLYRQLHRIHLVNYTFLATHHLFMAGQSTWPLILGYILSRIIQASLFSTPYGTRQKSEVIWLVYFSKQ